MQTFTPSLPAAPIAHALQFANLSTNDSASANEMDAVAQAWQLRADRAKFVADALRSQVESESGRIESASAGVQPTTVIVRNLPAEYSRQMFLNLLDSQGFAGKYDFVYQPRDFHRCLSLGYAFVNLVSHEEASRFQARLNGFSDWEITSRKICEVAWSNKHQGLDAQIRRYQNSSLMHESVPDDCKPMLFRQGVRISFPAPTQNLTLPHRYVA